MTSSHAVRVGAPWLTENDQRTVMIDLRVKVKSITVRINPD